jgi:hypothetical protein
LFDQYEFVAELLRLPSEFRFEAFLTLGASRAAQSDPSYSTCFFTIV